MIKSIKSGFKLASESDNEVLMFIHSICLVVFAIAVIYGCYLAFGLPISSLALLNALPLPIFYFMVGKGYFASLE